MLNADIPHVPANKARQGEKQKNTVSSFINVCLKCEPVMNYEASVNRSGSNVKCL